MFPRPGLLLFSACADPKLPRSPELPQPCVGEAAAGCLEPEGAPQQLRSPWRERSLGDADRTLTPTWSHFKGELGRSVAGLGDVDGDGRPDLAVGAPYGRDEHEVDSGLVFVLRSSGILSGEGSTLRAYDADLTVSAYGGALLGDAVAGPGDVDGDGRADLLVGAPAFSTGEALLFLSSGALGAGRSTLDEGDADLRLAGEITEGEAGGAVAGAGDVDGDGRADLLIGASNLHVANAREPPGAAYLLLSSGSLAGAEGELGLAEADLKLQGEQDLDAFGASLAGGADVDGDGRSDLLVGAPGALDADGVPVGAAYIVLGAGVVTGSGTLLGAGDADYRLVGERVGGCAGWSVAFPGDLDQDGLTDVVVGQPRTAVGGLPGLVSVLLTSGALAGGGATLDLDQADLTLLGEAADDRAGSAVSGAGDTDGDGRPDLLIGADQSRDPTQVGAAYLLLSSGALAATGAVSLADADLHLVGVDPGDLAGAAVAAAGDLDGDGLGELLIGAPGSGIDPAADHSGLVYLVYGASR